MSDESDAGTARQYLGLLGAAGFVTVWFVFWGFWQWLLRRSVR